MGRNRPRHTDRHRAPVGRPAGTEGCGRRKRSAWFLRSS
ncbi:hypothetical protein SHJG_5322 [Streptomyces hygroscopicus subsp. jinggangensis 5008]|nr:hypothetical protein SHJG_5322 [Streptomyces hygroscopicus subsp. jinggangensis 5008]AGF64749.1 hypothetical protein SHJGH_5086 [Streptomyces hygroscopicus subsp. jinggangensis TL01]